MNLVRSDWISTSQASRCLDIGINVNIFGQIRLDSINPSESLLIYRRHFQYILSDQIGFHQAKPSQSFVIYRYQYQYIWSDQIGFHLTNPVIAYI
jgi:hypothetical protein